MAESSRSPVWTMILFGIVRHGLTMFGTWLMSHHLIDADTHATLIEQGSQEVVGFLIVAASMSWSWMQKRQAWRWVRTALHLDETEATAEDVPTIAPGTNTPL